VLCAAYGISGCLREAGDACVALQSASGSGASGRQGGRARGWVRESLEEHWFEEAPVAECPDQKVAASLVLEDFHAAAAGDALGVEEVERVIVADVDLVAGLASRDWEGVEEIEGGGTAVGCKC
jgi:hypothetical protein